MKNLQHLEQAAEKCAADLLNLKNAIEALKAKEAAPVWPMSVEDLPVTANYHLKGNGVGRDPLNCKSLQNIFPTIEAANSAAAFSKLSRLVHHINGGDVFPADGKDWWHIINFNGKSGEFHGDWWKTKYVLPACLYFKNEADRDRSMIDHRDLWIQYFTGKKV